MDQRAGDGGQAFVELGIDGYERAVEIGRGGFSVVYRAWDPTFQRHVAVKVISSTVDPSEVDRFARECVAIGRLAGHPNIVTVHTAGRLYGGQPYIVMEYLSEGSLSDRIVKQPLDWATATDIGVKLAGALESAHRARVLHRDVKPANVMVSAYGECKLGDFGIARMEGGQETETGKVAASWDHAPPELVNGARPSPTSDVYSLASTLFMLMDGRPPFGLDPAESFVALLARIARDPVRPIRTSVPEAVEQVIREGLAKDPSSRPVSAAAFGQQLQAAQAALRLPGTSMPLALDAGVGSGTPVTEYVDLPTVPPTEPARTAVTPAPRPPTPPARRTGPLLLMATVVVVLLAFLAVYLAGGDGNEQTATTGSSPTSSASGPSSTSIGGAETPTSPPPTVSASAPTVASGQGVRLGQDLAPVTTEPCRAPTVATGGAWQLAPLQLGGRAFPVAYYCNLFAGAVGGLDFVLGGSYKLLTTSIGFADGSTSTSHMVRFEFIGDGRENLVDPTTVKFGDVRNLQVDVSGVTRLKIRITELSPSGGSEGASRPVLAAPTLTR